MPSRVGTGLLDDSSQRGDRKLVATVPMGTGAYLDGDEMRQQLWHLDGLGLSVTQGPKGRIPCLFLHGLGEGSYVWCDVVPDLLDAVSPVLPDLRGHGRSSWGPPDDYDVAHYSRDILHFLDLAGFKQLFVVGHSLGASVALDIAAARRRDIAGVILVELALSASEDTTGAFLEEFRASHTAYRSVDEYAERLAESRPLGQRATIRKYAVNALKLSADGHYVLRRDPAVARRAGAAADSLEALRKVEAPILIVRGQGSAFLSRRDERVVQALCPKSIFRAVPLSGHAVPSENPRYLATIMREFLLRHTPR